MCALRSTGDRLFIFSCFNLSLSSFSSSVGGRIHLARFALPMSRSAEKNQSRAFKQGRSCNGVTAQMWGSWLYRKNWVKVQTLCECLRWWTSHCLKWSNACHYCGVRLLVHSDVAFQCDKNLQLRNLFFNFQRIDNSLLA